MKNQLASCFKLKNYFSQQNKLLYSKTAVSGRAWILKIHYGLNCPFYWTVSPLYININMVENALSYILLTYTLADPGEIVV